MKWPVIEGKSGIHGEKGGLMGDKNYVYIYDEQMFNLISIRIVASLHCVHLRIHVRYQNNLKNKTQK